MSVAMDPNAPLPLTGERTTPGVPHENYWFQRHVVAYRFAAARIARDAAAADRRPRVLDAGSGEGYGAAMLAPDMGFVAGADVEPAVAARAAARYPDASFLACDLARAPWRPGAFDAAVSLQVIEHVPDPSAFLAACARGMRRGGVLVLATPNRLTFSPDGVVNPFHIIEFSPDELRVAVEAHFGAVEMFGVHHGSRIRALERIVGPFPARMLRTAPERWPRWLHSFVTAVRPSDFRIHSGDLDTSLDLIAVARASLSEG